MIVLSRCGLHLPDGGRVPCHCGRAVRVAEIAEIAEIADDDVQRAGGRLSAPDSPSPASDTAVVVPLRPRSRVRTLLVSDRAKWLPTGAAAQRRPPSGLTSCEGCGTTARLGTFAVCLWWPFGCETRADEPCPRLCWDCCGEHERLDLVDVGCVLAAIRLREGDR